MKKTIVSFAFLIASLCSASAKVSALFHPYDDTFTAIIERLERAESQIDLALYNVDSSVRNPIIAFIASDETQAKLRSGSLKIRLLFEGYQSRKRNIEKMVRLETFGIDVRYLGSSRKMHHKFGVIDGNGFNSSVITGSANWSLTSKKHYNENILFFDHEERVANNFQIEFNTLWSIAKEIGYAGHYDDKEMGLIDSSSSKVSFNINNFRIVNKRLYKSKVKSWVMTKKLVKAIDSAQTHIQIATTRIKLRPLYNAIKRAAARGVKVDIVVTMGEYGHKSKRYSKPEEVCPDEYQKNCSTSKNFSILLDAGRYKGRDNVDVRIKFFNIRTGAFLYKQMHSKYMIIDGETLYTGSFNWSYSAEFNHIENIVRLEAKNHEEVVQSFIHDFNRIYSLERELYSDFVSKLDHALKYDEKIPCGFTPMSLTFEEIDRIVLAGKRFNKETTEVCK